MYVARFSIVVTLLTASRLLVQLVRSSRQIVRSSVNVNFPDTVVGVGVVALEVVLVVLVGVIVGFTAVRLVADLFVVS